MKKNIILNLLLIVIIVCTGLTVYLLLKSGIRMEKWKEEVPQKEIGVKKEVTEEIEEKIEEEIEKEIPGRPLTRQDIMSYIASHISDLVTQISLEDPSGDWEVERFGFTTDEDVYVEYRHNEDLGQILVHCTGTTHDAHMDIKALFEPGANMWNLVKGEDTQFGKKIEFYEQDEQGNWISIHKY